MTPKMTMKHRTRELRKANRRFRRAQFMRAHNTMHEHDEDWLCYIPLRTHIFIRFLCDEPLTLTLPRK